MRKEIIEKILEEWNVCSCDNSALADRLLKEFSPAGDYIKKSEALSKANYYETGLTTGFEYVTTEDLNGLPTYSFPDSIENKGEITALEAENKTLRIKLENAEDVLRGLKEDLADARAELRERW